MSQESADAKKELKRIKAAERNSLPHRKEARRKLGIVRWKEYKVEKTAERCSQHTLDELLTIMRRKCATINLNFDEYRVVLETAAHILREDAHVFNASGTDDIQVPLASSSENSNTSSQKDDDRVYVPEPEV